MTLVPAVAAAGELHTPAAESRLDDVVVTAKSNVTTVHLKTSGRPKYQADFIDAPPRVVVDLEDTVFAWRPARPDYAGTPVRQIRASQFRKGVTRVVVELTGPASYAVREDSGGIAIVVGAAPTGREAAPVGREAAPVVMQLEKLPGRLDDGAAETRGPIVIAQAPPRPTTPPPPGPPGQRLISLDFKDADVVNLLRILAAESGKNVVISEDVKGKMSITLRNVPWEQALEIIMEARGLEKVERGNVLRIVTREQLVREREAAAKVEEARVKAEEAKAKADVEIRSKAAEAVVKEQEAQARKLALEQQLEEVRARGPIKEETIRLAYADPEDVARTLIGMLGISPGQALQVAPPTPGAGALPPGMTSISSIGGAPASERAAPPPPQISPELAAKGITIQAHKPTNSIFIRHYEKDIERIKKLIRETLDVQLPQIKIESRLVSLSRTDLFEVGVQWGGAGARRSGQQVLVGSGNIGGTGGGIGIIPFQADTSRTRGPMNPNLTLGTLLPAAAGTGLSPGTGNIVNLPLTAGSPTGGISFGIIGTRFSLNLQLQALETKTSTRTLARPEVVVMDNQKASITSGTEIGYQTGTAQTGFSVAFKDAALKLEVTPTVIREPDVTKIKMQLLVENNDVGAVIAGVPSISKQQTQTQVVVKEGETLVIGGVTRRSESDNVSKVPLFGDIPVLGWLFKRRTLTTPTDSELVVFITPTVLKDAPAGARPTAPPTR